MVLIGIDPHKATHTAVAVDTEETALPLCQPPVRHIKLPNH